MYKQPYIWPLTSMMQMPTHCSVCNQKFELESGFYFGTGYVSYALSVGFLVSYFAAYHLLIGLTVQNNSIIHCLISGIIILILLQPWMMRISRVLYLHLFVKYGANSQEGN